MPRSAVVMIVAFLAGCSSSTKVVRLDTGQGEPRVHVPRHDVESVEVNQEEFKEAIAKRIPFVPAVERPLEYAGRLFGLPERSGWFWYEGRSQRLMRSEPGIYENLVLLPEQETLKRAYLLWCAQTWGAGDCLRLLVDKPFLDGDAKYALAMAIAQSKVLGAMQEELARTVSPQSVVATIIGGLTMYAILLALPEPVSKGVAALLTLGAMAYLGWDTVWRLIDGWLVLMKEVDQATTFDVIAKSGEKFGDTMGEKAARAFVMLATVAMGNTAAGMAATLPKLPEAGQAALVAETQLHIRMTASALTQVESVAISADGVTIALAPNAVAMTAHATDDAVRAIKADFRAFKSMRDFKSAMGPAGEGKHWHHIVEQTPSNLERFGPEALHNSENVIAIDADTHVKISAYYSSKQKFTGGMVLREWLRTKSYEEQREFGLKTLRQFGVNP